MKAKIIMTFDEWNDASDAERFCNYFEQQARLDEAEAQRDQMREAILWALGERDEFPEEPELLAGKYKRRFYWRTELRQRAFGTPEFQFLEALQRMIKRYTMAAAYGGPVVALDEQGKQFTGDDGHLPAFVLASEADALLLRRIDAFLAGDRSRE